MPAFVYLMIFGALFGGGYYTYRCIELLRFMKVQDAEWKAALAEHKARQIENDQTV